MFFDQSGTEVRQGLTVTLHCDGVGACGGRCIDLLGDPDNCGACANECPVVQVYAPCDMGVCGTPCRDGFDLCDGETCRRLSEDDHNCGGCDVACAGGVGERPVCERNSAECRVLPAEHITIEGSGTYRRLERVPFHLRFVLDESTRVEINVGRGMNRDVDADGVDWTLFRVTAIGPWTPMTQQYGSSLDRDLLPGEYYYVFQGGDPAYVSFTPIDGPNLMGTDISDGGRFRSDGLAEDETDIYPLVLDAEASVTLRVTNGGEGCPNAADTVMVVYDVADDRIVAFNDNENGRHADRGNCSRVTARLPAGPHAVFVSGLRGQTVDAYTLQVLIDDR